MRWTLLVAAGCVPRIPADPLPAVAPPLDAPDYATEPLREGSEYAWAAIANLQVGALADGVGVESDERLSRVAARLAWDWVGSGRLPATRVLQEMAADAGAPYVLPVVGIEVLPRRRPIALDLYAKYGPAVPGSGLPIAAGVAAWEREDETVLALVLVRRAFWLAGPVPRDGAAVVPIVGALDAPEYGLLAVDAEGAHLTRAPAGEGRTASPAVPIRDGWVEVVALDGGRSSALGLLRLGEPPAWPAAPSADDPDVVVAGGVAAIREAANLTSLRLLPGVPDCAEVPDEVGGVEVLRDQSCVEVPVSGLEDVWAALVQRPLFLRTATLANAELVQVGVDAEAATVAVRTLRPFERLTLEEATERVAALVEARWPGVQRATSSPFPELARGWAESRDPAAAAGELALRADDVAARWAGSGRWMRLLGASQEVERLLQAGDAVRQPAEYAVGVAVGEGSEGEPMYYAVVGFRM